MRPTQQGVAHVVCVKRQLLVQVHFRLLQTTAHGDQGLRAHVAVHLPTIVSEAMWETLV